MAVPGTALGVKYFKSGRTAGEITDHSAVVWARTTRNVEVRAIVATDSSFRHVVARKKLKARSSTDRTVQTKIRSLDANQTYHYHFCVVRKHTCSGKGQFETAPKPSDPKTIRLAYTGDETGVTQPATTIPSGGSSGPSSRSRPSATTSTSTSGTRSTPTPRFPDGRTGRRSASARSGRCTGRS